MIEIRAAGQQFTGQSDDEGNPIPTAKAPKKETGKSFNDAIKDLYWDVLGREPDAAGLEAYKKAFGAEISPEEEQEFYRTAKEELRNRGEGAGDPLYKLYAQNLGRAPTLEEYRKSREQFGGDVSGEEEQQFFEQEVVPDLRRRQDPIFQLYQEELGRTPDVGGYRLLPRRVWSARLHYRPDASRFFRGWWVRRESRNSRSTGFGF
jgi:hypothetical protein